MNLSLLPWLQVSSSTATAIAAATQSSCTIPLDNLEPEVAFYWRCLCKYFKTKYETCKDGKDLEKLEAVTPTLLEFCQYLTELVETRQ